MHTELGAWPQLDEDAELSSLAQQLRKAGYWPTPVVLPGADVQLCRVARGEITVVALAKYGTAIVARYEALYDTARPLEHAGRQLDRVELDPLTALRRLVAELDTRPFLTSGLLPDD